MTDMKLAIGAALFCCVLISGASAQGYSDKDFPAQLPVPKGAKAPSTDITPPYSPEREGES
jgi:hypothetical protein